MLLLVSVVVGALAPWRAGGVIKPRGGGIVCRIAGGGCGAGQQPLVHATASGPPLGGGRPITVLPFPGSVGVSCTYDERSPSVCEGSDANGVGVTVTAGTKIERTPTTLDANGCPWQTASVSTGLKLTGSIKDGNKRFGGSLSTYLGRSTNYSITTSPGAMDAIAAGRRDAPNPVDP